MQQDAGDGQATGVGVAVGLHEDVLRQDGRDVLETTRRVRDVDAEHDEHVPDGREHLGDDVRYPLGDAAVRRRVGLVDGTEEDERRHAVRRRRVVLLEVLAQLEDRRLRLVARHHLNLRVVVADLRLGVALQPELQLLGLARAEVLVRLRQQRAGAREARVACPREHAALLVADARADAVHRVRLVAHVQVHHEDGQLLHPAYVRHLVLLVGGRRRQVVLDGVVQLGLHQLAPLRAEALVQLLEAAERVDVALSQAEQKTLDVRVVAIPATTARFLLLPLSRLHFSGR